MATLTYLGSLIITPFDPVYRNLWGGVLNDIFEDIDDELARLDGLVGVGTQTIGVPGGAMTSTTTSGAERVQVEVTAGRPEVLGYAFDKTTEEYVQFSATMPKSWDGGAFNAIFHWTQGAETTTRAVRWGIQALVVKDGDVINTAYGTAVELSDACGTTLYREHISAVSGDITAAGTAASGAVNTVYFRVYRDVSDAADTLDGDAILVGVDILYTTDAPTDA